ncbi:DNRLRE domain-containing protein, partial [Candidatus Chloroploca sp. M-50]
MNKKSLLHWFLLVMLSLQLAAPFVSYQSVWAHPADPSPGEVLLAPSPLPAQVSEAWNLSEVGLDQAHHVPDQPELISAGTQPPLLHSVHRVYLPLIINGAPRAVERRDLRNRYAKVYQYPDRSGYALAYAAPIHYLNEIDEWETIDNTLILDPHNPGTYRNAANDFIVQIATRETVLADAGSLAHASLGLRFGSLRMTLRPAQARTSEPQVRSSSLTFADLLADTSITYEALSNGVTVLADLHTQESRQRPLSFELQVPDGQVSLVDGAVQIGNTDARLDLHPIATTGQDQIGIVTTTITHVGEDRYQLVFQLDPEWLQTLAPDLPITLRLVGELVRDAASLAAINDQGVVEDAFVQQRFPTVPTWDQARLYVGYDPPNGPNGTNWKAVTRTYIQFGFPALPPGSVINSASANLYQYFSQAGTYQTRVSRVVDEWVSSKNALTWNNQRNVTEEQCCTTVDGSAGYKAWNITNYARAWQTGTPNFGMLIQSSNEAATGGSIFWSANSVATNPRPFLRIDYSENPVLQVVGGIQLTPGSTVARGTDVTASFVVRNDGGGNYNGVIRANTGGAPTFAEISASIGQLGGTFAYNNTVRFDANGSFNVCAEFFNGVWNRLPPDNGGPCRTLNLVDPAQLQLEGALSITPNDLSSDGGNARAQFTVLNTDGALPAEGRLRALVRGSSVSFMETSQIRLNPGERYTYDMTSFFATPGVYEVEAQRFDQNSGQWVALIGNGSGYVRVQNPTPPPLEPLKGTPTVSAVCGDPVNTATGNYFYDFPDLRE